MICTALLPLLLACASSEEVEYRRNVMLVPDDGTLIALREMNGDGRKDLLWVRPEGFAVRYLHADGSFSAEDDATLAWPSERLAWDLIDLNDDGVFEIVTLSGEGLVQRWSPGTEGKFESDLLIETRSYMPRGVSRMNFARDVNGDGHTDLVLPVAGLFQIYLQSDQATWEEPFEIQYEAQISYAVGDPTSLESSFGQTVRIPWFRLEDIDGDGTQDLISATSDRVDFHLAQPQLSATPTWTLDLAGLRSDLPKNKGIDLDDLFANIEARVEWKIEDVDGVAPRDLVLLVGSTIKVYLGGSTVGPVGRPDDVLKLSGTLLGFLVRNTQGSALPDLQLIRGERLSVGTVLRWLILPGSLEFDLFTYENTAGKFSRKPTRRNTIQLKIPRLLSFIDEVQELEETIEAQQKVPAQRADLDGDGVRNDIIDVEGGEVLLFLECAPPDGRNLNDLDIENVEGLLEEFVLEDLDALEDGAVKSFDLGGVTSWNFTPGVTLREARQGKDPMARIKAPASDGEFGARGMDLTGDGRDEVLVWVELEDGSHLLQIMLRVN